MVLLLKIQLDFLSKRKFRLSDDFLDDQVVAAAGLRTFSAFGKRQQKSTEPTTTESVKNDEINNNYRPRQSAVRGRLSRDNISRQTTVKPSTVKEDFIITEEQSILEVQPRKLLRPILPKLDRMKNTKNPTRTTKPPSNTQSPVSNSDVSQLESTSAAPDANVQTKLPNVINTLLPVVIRKQKPTRTSNKVNAVLKETTESTLSSTVQATSSKHPKISKIMIQPNANKTNTSLETFPNKNNLALPIKIRKSIIKTPNIGSKDQSTVVNLSNNSFAPNFKTFKPIRSNLKLNSEDVATSSNSSGNIGTRKLPVQRPLKSDLSSKINFQQPTKPPSTPVLSDFRKNKPNVLVSGTKPSNKSIIANNIPITTGSPDLRKIRPTRIGVNFKKFVTPATYSSSLLDLSKFNSSRSEVDSENVTVKSNVLPVTTVRSANVKRRRPSRLNVKSVDLGTTNQPDIISFNTNIDKKTDQYSSSPVNLDITSANEPIDPFYHQSLTRTTSNPLSLYTNDFKKVKLNDKNNENPNYPNPFPTFSTIPYFLESQDRKDATFDLSKTHSDDTKNDSNFFSPGFYKPPSNTDSFTSGHFSYPDFRLGPDILEPDPPDPLSTITPLINNNYQYPRVVNNYATQNKTSATEAYLYNAWADDFAKNFTQNFNKLNTTESLKTHTSDDLQTDTGQSNFSKNGVNSGLKHIETTKHLTKFDEQYLANKTVVSTTPPEISAIIPNIEHEKLSKNVVEKSIATIEPSWNASTHVPNFSGENLENTTKNLESSIDFGSSRTGRRYKITENVNKQSEISPTTINTPLPSANNRSRRLRKKNSRSSNQNNSNESPQQVGNVNTAQTLEEKEISLSSKISTQNFDTANNGTEIRSFKNSTVTIKGVDKFNVNLAKNQNFQSIVDLKRDDKKDKLKTSQPQKMTEHSKTLKDSKEKHKNIHVIVNFNSESSQQNNNPNNSNSNMTLKSHFNQNQIAPINSTDLSSILINNYDYLEITPTYTTSVIFSERLVTTTRLRTYTHVVTKVNGHHTEIKSSTAVKPKVLTKTVKVPITITVTPTKVSSSNKRSSNFDQSEDDEDAIEEEGRRFNLATRVMSNGVEVIVAGTTPAYRWENANPHPTLTLSEAVVMHLPQDKPNDFITKTCTTTFTYLNTVTRDGSTMILTDQQVVANTATEERHRKPGSESASFTLEASPTLQTEVFKTTYTYLMLNTDHADQNDAFESSTRVIENTVTAPQYYLDMILEPSEVQRPETHTYLSTKLLEKTYVEDGKTKIDVTNGVVTQLIITETAAPIRTVNTKKLENVISKTIEIPKTYFITYTYYDTYLDKDKTIVKTNIATSTNVVFEKASSRKNVPKSSHINATPEPIQIFATKTYLTTFTYFTTLLQAGNDGKTSTSISTSSKIVENVVTESIAPSLLDANYIKNSLKPTSHNPNKNIVTGSTIIFFDDETSLNPTRTSIAETLNTARPDQNENSNKLQSSFPSDSVGSETNEATSRPVEPENNLSEEESENVSTQPPKKPPYHMSNLLNFGSFGLNSLSALGPVITAMAGLLKSKTTATRRNDTIPAPQHLTQNPVSVTPKISVRIPSSDLDIETAESQNIALHLSNNNKIPETRHKVTSSIADGIPISPGEIIHANSDVVIGKPGRLSPRPPFTHTKEDQIGTKQSHYPQQKYTQPVLQVIEKQPTQNLFVERIPSHLEIVPANQIYEKHINTPVYHSRPIGNPLPSYPSQKIISSKQDILENDPLMVPPIPPNVEENNRHPNIVKNQSFFNWHKNTLHQNHEFITEPLINNPHVPEPVVHQVPHVIDRATGQPLLVNIQPSQVANVVIPQGGTQALIFGDANEPHISGQYFDDPVPYHDAEVGTGFFAVNRDEHVSIKGAQLNIMKPPTPDLVPQKEVDDKHKNLHSRHENAQFYQNIKSNMPSSQGQVYSEILVHPGHEYGQENSDYKPQSHRPLITPNRLLKPQMPPRRDHTQVYIPAEQLPPRRSELSSADNLHYDPNYKNEKKPSRTPSNRWHRPSIKPRPPPRLPGPYRPYRPERPGSHSSRPQLMQKVPNQHFQQELPISVVSFDDGNRKSQLLGNSIRIENQQHLPKHDSAKFIPEKMNDSISSSSDSAASKVTNANNGEIKEDETQKLDDSYVDASENIKISSETYGIDLPKEDNNNSGDSAIVKNFEKVFNHQRETMSSSNKEIYESLTSPNDILVTPETIFEPNGHSRPYQKPHLVFSKTENLEDTHVNFNPPKPDYTVNGHMLPGPGQVIMVGTDSLYNEANKRNESKLQLFDQFVKRPNIITKVRPQLPKPVVISSAKIHKQPVRRPPVQFSLPIDSTGDEKDSSSQTERPPSTHLKPQMINDGLLKSDQKVSFSPAFHGETGPILRYPVNEYQKDATPYSRVSNVSHILNKIAHTKDSAVGVKRPYTTTEIVGLSPPFTDRTTSGPAEKRLNQSLEISIMKPPPLIVPIKKVNITYVYQNNTAMTTRTSTRRPTNIPVQESVRQTPTVKPVENIKIPSASSEVEVSGNIKIASTIATSQIPMQEDLKTKTPTIHGTINMIAPANISAYSKSVETRKGDRVTVNTPRPFEVRPKTSEKQSIITTTSSLRPAYVDATKVKTNTVEFEHGTTIRTTPTPRYGRPSKTMDFSLNLEPSDDLNYLLSSKIESTDYLSTSEITKTSQKSSDSHTTSLFDYDVDDFEIEKSSEIPVHTSTTRTTNLKLKESASKMMEIIGTVVHEFIQNSTSDREELKPIEVTHYETLTITRTETAVVGSPPTIRTSLLTHTLTSTSIETVTETIDPTNVISTHAATFIRSSIPTTSVHNNEHDNDSIFVVMSDQNLPGDNAEKVEAEYGSEDEDISRDEDLSGNEIHRVLSGGILTPSIAVYPPKIQCIPECKAAKAEMCTETSNGETRCICRPGFSRLFPDRPCKPTYTYTLGVGLDRIGRDRFAFEESVNDTNSNLFKRYSDVVKDALDRTLMQSDLRDMYRGVNIAEFTSNPEKVLFHLQLSSNTDEESIKDVFRRYLVTSNFSLGGTDVYASNDLGLVEASDFNECSTNEEIPHNDCSPNAICFNVKGSYQCSCKEGYADISENSAYPGRICSQAPLGCAACNNKGHCNINTNGKQVCECFPWYTGQKCQVNLKVTMIAVVAIGVIILGLVGVCIGAACFRSPGRRRTSADRRAMIPGVGNDTSSEGSVTELAIPHHVPHVLPPPPQMLAPIPPMKKAGKKIAMKQRRAPKRPAPMVTAVPINTGCPMNEQRDRSLTVMIPRAKYRSAPQQATTPQNYKTMSTFAVDEHKLIDYLEGGAHPSEIGINNSKQIQNTDYHKESEHKNLNKQQHSNFLNSGALVSAGFQVSATVNRQIDAESTLARSCGETTIEPSTKMIILRNADFPHSDVESTLARSCGETTICASTKQLIKLEMAEAGSTLARSCGGETTVHPSIKLTERKDCSRNIESHTAAERDLGRAHRHTAYNQDRASTECDSNFDSL